MHLSPDYSCETLTIQEQNSPSAASFPPRVTTAKGSGRCGHPSPPVCLTFPTPDDHEWRRQIEAQRVSDRLTQLLKEIGMPCTGGPLFEEDGEDDTHVPEIGSSLPTVTDPYMVEESGHLYITTWGGLYEKPSTLWDQRGGCVAAQVRAMVALSGDLFFSTRGGQR